MVVNLKFKNGVPKLIYLRRTFSLFMFFVVVGCSSTNTSLSNYSERPIAKKVPKTIEDIRRESNYYVLDILHAQKILNDLGHYNGIIDGIYGPGTALALKSFQVEKGLEQTGELDPKTESLMIDGYVTILKTSSKSWEAKGCSFVFDEDLLFLGIDQAERFKYQSSDIKDIRIGFGFGDVSCVNGWLAGSGGLEFTINGMSRVWNFEKLTFNRGRVINDIFEVKRYSAYSSWSVSTGGRVGYGKVISGVAQSISESEHYKYVKDASIKNEKKRLKERDQWHLERVALKETNSPLRELVDIRMNLDMGSNTSSARTLDEWWGSERTGKVNGQVAYEISMKEPLNDRESLSLSIGVDLVLEYKTKMAVIVSGRKERTVSKVFEVSLEPGNNWKKTGTISFNNLDLSKKNRALIFNQDVKLNNVELYNYVTQIE
jgi:peptidoglycan hydrolase-like protein with peptidoglycan-binding domain